MDLRRQVVVCCDGTNNTLTGGAEDTSVVRLHNLFATQPAPPGWERVLYYDPGVGSPGVLPPVGPVEWLSRSFDRATGLASGGGTYENIAAAYLFLMRHWRGPEDHICLFGFSRGAFTVRAVAGMVHLFGIVRREYESLVPTLVHLYFAPSGRSKANTVQHLARELHARTIRPDKAAAEPGGHAPVHAVDKRGALAEEVRLNFADPGSREAWVHWIGVWDTVESVGLPGPLSRVNPSPPTMADKRYRNVRQALSLDEHRWPFLPRLYEEPGDIVAGGRTLKQRWYPGVHCDTGGSYRRDEAGLSDAAFRWMVQEASAELGIAMPPHEPAAPMWCHDPLWDTPYWAVAGMTLREMQPRIESRVGGEPEVMHLVPADNLPSGPLHSVWERRRPLWPLLLALVLGFDFLVVSGLCLVGREQWHQGLAALLDTLDATRRFADSQLAALWGQGVMAPGHRPWEMVVQPGWAMFWDLGFVACWGYLLSRMASRGFAFLAGRRTVHSPRPRWLLLLGFMPMLAVLGDVGEDLSLWAALALHDAGTDVLALCALWLGSLGSVAKFAGLLGCLPYAPVWAWASLARRPRST